MVKKNLFRYSSVLMCVVLTAASLVGCGANTAATTGTDTAYVTEMAAGRDRKSTRLNSSHIL